MEASVWGMFIEPWALRGMLAGALAALSCAWLGVFLYLRGMSMLTDALAHVALPGVVLAWLLTGRLDAGTLVVGAGALGILAALAIEWLGRRPAVRTDAAIGIVFTALFAAGIIVLSSVLRDTHLDVHCLLFGDLLGVSDRSLLVLLIAVPLTALLVALGWRGLVASSFDLRWAVTAGLPASVLQAGLLTWTAVVSAASFEAVGVVLVIGLFILPAATAHRLCRTLRGMMAVASLAGAGAAVAGFVLAVLLDVAPSGTVVLLQGLVYLAVLVLTRRHTGWLGRGRTSGEGRDAQRLRGELPQGHLAGAATHLRSRQDEGARRAAGDQPAVGDQHDEVALRGRPGGLPAVPGGGADRGG